MGYLLLILIVAVVLWAFWLQGQQTERVKLLIDQRCQQVNVQMLSVARERYSVRWSPLLIQTHYHFEFSANGDDCYQGHAVMSGLRVQSITMQPYPVY